MNPMLKSTLDETFLTFNNSPTLLSQGLTVPLPTVES